MEVNTLELDSLSVNTSSLLYFYAFSWCTRKHTKWRLLQIPALLSTFPSLVSAGKDVGFV